jgi:hypothetical protein
MLKYSLSHRGRARVGVSLNLTEQKLKYLYVICSGSSGRIRLQRAISLPFKERENYFIHCNTLGAINSSQ